MFQFYNIRLIDIPYNDYSYLLYDNWFWPKIDFKCAKITSVALVVGMAASKAVAYQASGSMVKLQI